MTHTPLEPFAATAGPRPARIVLVGEAWGETEEQLRQPFVGASGKELWLMLGEATGHWPEEHARVAEMHRYGNSWVSERGAWLVSAGIAMTNVLALRPPGNNLEAICGTKAEVGKAYNLPALSKGKYLREEYLGELDRLSVEFKELRPNLVVALGNSACWAVLQATNIGSIRGNVTVGSLGGMDFKVLPTYHPAGVMRQWSWRPIVLADLMKAWREAEFPEIRRPQRQILINPTIEEVEAWTAETLEGNYTRKSPDIETAYGQIKCIGFARSRSEAMVVPFLDEAKPGWSYWPSQQLEERAWACVVALLESDLENVGQNFLYDLQYITRLGIQPKALAHDTMLLHHSLFPEMQKGLGFLGSIYTSEQSWKLMRKRKADTEKRDE